MREGRTTRGLLVAAGLTAVLIAGSLLGGCCAPPAGTGSDEATATVPPGSVVVPDVIGKYYGDAALVLQEAGLAPKEVSVQGRVDDDAGEVGKVYRQTPKAGEKVAPGTTVELRSWRESQ